MKEKLSTKQLLVMGGALFSMHFGAACMLFPVQWGKDAGTALWPVFAGILISGIMLPFLGYLALVKGNGTFLSVSKRLSPRFGVWFAALTVFVIGPLYMIPRMSAAAWAAIVQITGTEMKSSLPVIVFSVVFYLITYWFVMNPGKVVDKIGNILFPVLLAVVIAVIAKSLISPLSDTWAAPSFTQNPVIYGILQGYATADLQCSLVFGIIIVQGIRNAGIGEKSINRNLILIGIIGLGLLMLTMIGHMIAGANTGGTIDLTLSALYTEMVLRLWGRAGGILFIIALTAAALTTAIGAVSSTSGIWEEILQGKEKKAFSYRNLCIVSCVLSCIVSLADLDAIVRVVGPVLDAFYPPAIVLAFYYCFCPHSEKPENLKAGKWAFIVTFAVSMIELLIRYDRMFDFGLAALGSAFSRLPLAQYSLTWLPVSIVIFAAVLCLQKSGSRHSETS